ncbi:MAG: hypothetical protein A3B10_00880 [Candidatus Doudnabacteria bacterium RIFCSPLOWO2_01_FULL_44_21]|uniref:Uncharacterized protein n=1 Tax=Candidatus Doudnabacteria bacterium RIFCSPLOWO2_01_FULL_44_21 TaxID=1817841 RepID=A0A1F5PX89_9BACT|nr:MAG: hypothetical protein A3B10_00880 [Candidatus Doudnabacteria bacterium RIFCSPLOWO2_01_FULL_44_21]
MIEKLSRRDNRTETREFLFERLEAKIAILRKLWSVAQVLSAPEAGESSELTEKLFLAKIFSEARDKFPLAEREFGEYEQIKKSLASLQKKMDKIGFEKGNDKYGEQFDALIARREDLLEDDDFRFLLSIREGITTLLKKRDEIRTVLANIEENDKDPKSLWPVLPEPYREQLKGKPIELLPNRFSISIVLEGKEYEELFHDSSLGRHIHDSVWSFVKKDASPIEQTRAHEDFHSFAEGFSIGSANLFSPEKIREAIQSIITIKSQGAPLAIVNIFLTRLKHRIIGFKDYGYDEFLAELASLPYRKIPADTFATNVHEAQQILEEFKGKDPDIDPIIDEGLKYLDVEEFRNRIQNIYKRVEVFGPKRIPDLIFAFSLIPPSRLRHIERLVERWAEQDKKVE